MVKAAADGDNPKCEYILNMPGSNVNGMFNGYSALHSACQNGHLAVIETLVKYNADLEIEVYHKYIPLINKRLQN